MPRSSSIANLPNFLTLLRLAGLPIAIFLFRRDHNLAAGAVFFFAMLTDCFDGWLARRFKQCTPLGLYLDAVVDKIVAVAMFYELAFAHPPLMPIAVAHLFLARELLQDGVRSSAAVRGTVVGANWMGKVKLFLQTVLIVAGLLAPIPITMFSAPIAQGILTALHVFAWGLLALAWGFFFTFLYWNWRLLGA
ncbi:CDP-alcohol phosphatidyltransferase family protein [Candidatus Sumerlaeota bacterium]|nr:CDP-alcohol phosphatidyltransferase family protein [Candidatus Sumerlaeota bacterium]